MHNWHPVVGAVMRRDNIPWPQSDLMEIRKQNLTALSSCEQSLLESCRQTTWHQYAPQFGRDRSTCTHCTCTE
eukprot:5198401-Prorocentrum_lima.AAC.1